MFGLCAPDLLLARSGRSRVIAQVVLEHREKLVRGSVQPLERRFLGAGIAAIARRSAGALRLLLFGVLAGHAADVSALSGLIRVAGLLRPPRKRLLPSVPRSRVSAARLARL